MRSILSFAAVICGIIFMHASKIKLPENPATISPAEDINIPGSTHTLPSPAASEALVYMEDSLFQTYRGNHNLFVTNHYHVLYVKTDSIFITDQGPVSTRQLTTMNFLYR